MRPSIKQPKLRWIKRIAEPAQKWKSPLRIVALTILAAASLGCDNKSQNEESSPVAEGLPADGGEVSPPRPIAAESLPFAADELNVVAAFPGPGEQRVALVSPISITFDAPLQPGQDLSQAVRVSAAANEISGSVSQLANDTLIFRPAGLWQPSQSYTIEIDSALMSAEGYLVNPQLQWEFVTIADVYTTPQSIIDLCMSDLDVEMLAAVNQARSVARSCNEAAFSAAGKLAWNCRLQEAAIGHSQDMANKNFFEHTGSDGSHLAERLTRAGYAARVAGENLAAGYPTTATAMAGLLDSYDHCTTIMNPEFSEFGFGYAFNTDSGYRHYWTQNFARPSAR